MKIAMDQMFSDENEENFPIYKIPDEELEACIGMDSMPEGVGVYFEDHRESRDLGRLALRGGLVSVAMQYGNGVIQIVATIVLARLLARRILD